jgi:hypothetical protein
VISLVRDLLPSRRMSKPTVSIATST